MKIKNLKNREQQQKKVIELKSLQRKTRKIRKKIEVLMYKNWYNITVQENIKKRNQFLACYFFSVFLTTRLCCLELSIVLNTLMECSFSCFLLSNLISLRIFLFKITFSKVSLFLLRTFLLRSGYFYENFDLT